MYLSIFQSLIYNTVFKLIKEAEKIDAAELEAQKVSEEAGNQE